MTATEPTSPTHPPVRHVLIAGYGPVGRVVADLLEKIGVAVTVIDRNAVTCERQAQLDRRVVHGDASDPAVLRDAGLCDADALILAIPDEDEAIQACRVARQINQDIFIAVRTNYLSKGLGATVAGADSVVVEEVVTAEAMKAAVLEGLLHGRGHAP